MKTEPRIKVENNMQKWLVVKDEDIKQSQEFKYALCWN